MARVIARFVRIAKRVDTKLVGYTSTRVLMLRDKYLKQYRSNVRPYQLSLFSTRLNISFLFSRSYCYTVWSAIGIIMSSVRLSVCLWRCALWLSGLVYMSVYRAKSCTSVLPVDKFPFVRSDTCCRMYHLATKCTGKICSYNSACSLLTFLFTGRDAAIRINSVKTESRSSEFFSPIVLLHAVRSAITAIAELLVILDGCRI